MIRKVVLFFCLFSLLCTGAALAHRVNVFAWSENGTIHIESGFSGGRKAKEARVQVQDASGNLLLEGVTNEAGNWSFPVPDRLRQAPQDLTLVVIAGEGHRGEWPLKAQEYLVESTQNQTLIDQRTAPGPLKIGAGLFVLLALALGIHFWRKSR